MVENEPQKAKEQVVQPSVEVQPPSIPFPRRLRKEKEEAQQQKFLENLKQLHINLPFIEALAQMPQYAKFLKILLTNKVWLEEDSTVTMNERCSAVLLNKLSSKQKHPGSFTIPCNIVYLHINNALADLGDSISLIPYMMYEKLALGEPKRTRMSLELADREAIFENSSSNDRCIYKKITLRVGDDEVIFDVDHSVKRPLAEDDKCCGIDDLDETINETTRSDGVEIEHLYLTSANEIDEKKHKLKDLPHHLEYAYLHSDKSFPIIIPSILFEKEKMLLLQILEKHRGPFAWKMSEIKGTSPSFCTHKLLMEDDFKPVIQPQRRLNRKVQDKGGMIVVLNDNNELIPSHMVTGWRVCFDYRKLYDVTQKDHFPLPFIVQMFKRLFGYEYYYFLDGFSRFFQIPIAPEDQEKKMFTCPCGTFAYKRMLIGLCNVHVTFQRCMTTIFHDMVDDFMKVFMGDFSVFDNSFSSCLFNLDKMLASKQDAKPRLIRWVLLVHDFDIETKDKKSKKLSYRLLIKACEPRFRVFTKEEIPDEFPDEYLMMLKAKPNDDEPWLVRYNPKDWSEKLNNALWAFRTTYKIPTGCTPFILVYGEACHITVKIKHKAYWALKHCNMDLATEAKTYFIELNELMELRDGAYENTRIYKERTKEWHDSRLRGDKDFKVRDKVFLFNS
uniref:Reverse transcriptase domain-containing protein n=1 Tax=Tanacetum cinerariifolium TaxID=118510 RepID=A0A6L2KAJ1_TANCI|nr:reverse transcriptase domain-containing protein [Tanacetum cinerariifolium]